MLCQLSYESKLPTGLEPATTRLRGEVTASAAPGLNVNRPRNIDHRMWHWPLAHSAHTLAYALAGFEPAFILQMKYRLVTAPGDSRTL